jgi:hypothetical protein
MLDMPLAQVRDYHESNSRNVRTHPVPPAAVTRQQRPHATTAVTELRPLFSVHTQQRHVPTEVVMSLHTLIQGQLANGGTGHAR